MKYKALTRKEIVNTIEGKGVASRIPVVLQFWVHPESFGADKPKVLNIMNEYEQDIQAIFMDMPRIFTHPKDMPNYRISYYDDPYPPNAPIDSKIVINDWEEEFEKLVADFPSPEYEGLFPNVPEDDGRYRLGYWWHGLFERLWQIRGMTNGLMDFYLYPEYVHECFDLLTNFYLRAMEIGKEKYNFDGFFMSDDLGTQSNSFFSKEIFLEFFKPYYIKIINKAHELGCHFWLHSCGNILNFMDEFVEIGLDVLHPIQKYTMEEKEIKEKYGDKICIWAGFDVQQTIPWGSTQDVENEAKFLIDTYYNKNGRLMLTAGNGINEDCPLDSLATLFESFYAYGEKKANLDQ